MRYLLDTTVLIDHANGFPPATELLERLFAQGAELFTCDVVTCEALSGGTDEHLEVIGRLLEPLEYVSTSPTAARRAGASRLTRHRAEGRLGLGDALIAAVAVEIDASVVTRNRPDFERQGAPTLTY
ncbi:MAG TPA: PIN domain-containing protein [Candidatus Limnocylindria bacterium]|nr:PIN domain-containing protein [Candidatus Limnocylindria bacterium]